MDSKIRVPKTNNKIPCNRTRFFFEKVNGKQFHPKYSGCDDFSIRLQVRKHPSVSWNKLMRNLYITDWIEILTTKGMSCGNKSKLVASFRFKKFGNHIECVESSPEYKRAIENIKKNPKSKISYDWPINCKLRKKLGKI